MFASRVVTVSDTPTVVLMPSARRCSFLLRNVDTTKAVWVGGPLVATTGGNRGFKFNPDEFLSADISQFMRAAAGAMYMIAQTGQSVEIEVLEVFTGAG